MSNSQQLGCPDEDRLNALLLGKLTDAEASELEAHFLNCDACLQRANRAAPADSLVEAFQDLRISPPSADASLASLVDEIAKRASLRAAERSDTEVCRPSLHDTQGDVAGPRSTTDVSFLDPPQAKDEIGRLGDFRILEVIGTGGMGVVFKAEDLKLRRTVALKCMKPQIAADLSAKERFQREARAAAAIDHDNVVTIYQVGESSSVPFIAQQLLEGESLADRLNREGCLPPSEVLRITRQIAMGLGAAHDRGLLHRDIKPDNIWLESGTDRVKLLDFGLARALEDQPDAKNPISLTDSGLIVGTPSYMSPEQIDGKTLDALSDLFSLGSVMYRMLRGKPPFRRPTLTATFKAIAHDKVDELENVDYVSDASAIMIQLLEKDPADRFQSAHEVVRRIEHAATASIAPAKSTGKRWIGLWVAAAGVLLLLAAVAAIIIQTKQGRLIIEADESVVAEIRGEKFRIHDAGGGDKYEIGIGENRLSPGTYQLEVESLPDGLQFSTQEFQIRRFGDTILTVKFMADKAGGMNELDTEPATTTARLQLTELPPLKGCQTALRHLHFAPNGKSLYSTETGGVVRQWDLETHTELQTWSDRSIDALSDDGRYAVGKRMKDGTALQLWDLTTAEGKVIREFEMEERLGGGQNIDICSASHKLIAGSKFGEAKIWDLETGELIQSLPKVNSDTKDQVFDGATAGKFALTGDLQRIRYWDTETGALLREFPGRGRAVFSRNGRSIFAACMETGGACIWSVDGSEEPIEIGMEGAFPIRSISLSPSGRFVLAGLLDGELRIWRMLTGKQEWVMSDREHRPHEVAWSPTGDVIAGGGGKLYNRDGFSMDIPAGTEFHIRLWRVKVNE